MLVYMPYGESINTIIWFHLILLNAIVPQAKTIADKSMCRVTEVHGKTAGVSLLIVLGQHSWKLASLLVCITAFGSVHTSSDTVQKVYGP